MGNSHVVHGSTGGSVAACSIYDAARAGSAVDLDRLLEQYGWEALCRLSLTSFAETPLHLAAALGHLEFSKRLLDIKSDLASEQDSERCTPLHLAAANGHHQVVRELLKACDEACLVQDQEGRIPLHLAAMRGRVQVVKELLKSAYAQESLKKKVDDGDGIIHLCVKYNHLGVLKQVLAATNYDEEVSKMTDSLGNTILHLAVMLKQAETVRFLLELPKVKTEVINISNKMGFNALDVLNHAPKDFKILEIRGLLVAEKGAETIRPIHPTLSANRMRDEDGAAEVPAKVQEQAQESWILRRWVWAVWPLLEKLMEYKGDWMNETKGAPMMVSSIIATVTFAAAIAPPGGVWQEDTTYSCDNSPSCQICNNESICYAGSAVLGSYYPYDYIRFMKYDMTSFISALVVLFLLMSGFPLNNKFCLWLLSLAMCVTVSFLGRTFLLAMWLTIPYEMMSDFDRWKTVSYDVWRATVCAVALCLLGFGTCTKALG